MQFSIRAVGPAGIETLQLEAASAEAARREALARQFQPISIRQVASWRRASGADFDLLLFSEELLALLSAGLALTEALAALHEKERRPAAAAVLAGLRASLADGRRFAAALAEQPAIFPPLYCGLMRSAEGTSSLDSALSRFIEYRQRIDQIRRHVGQAMIYPAILLAVGGLVSLFLLGYVVPSFASVYQNAGRELPLASRWLLQWGRLVSEHAWAVALPGIGILAAVAWHVSSATRRGRLLESLRQGAARLPRVGQFLRTFELARLYLALGTLLEGGIPILAALELCSGVVSAAVCARIDEVMDHIREGIPASEAFDRCALATPVALRLMRVGEHTGQLADMLMRAARFHDAEVERFIARFTRSFEPLLMAAIGIVVGTIVVLLYMPIFDLAGSFQ